jgi:4'-phosphopantetheinyl transferase EntD
MAPAAPPVPTSGVSLVPLIGLNEVVAVASTVIPDRESDGQSSIDGPTEGERPALLHPYEWTMAATMSRARRPTFVAGRIALRAAALAAAPSVVVPPLLVDHRGAPQLPRGVLGSISHKRTRAIAIALAGTHGFVGIDLETRPHARDAHRPSIAPRILTAREQDQIHALDPLAHREATLLRFALKEAIYKAIDPLVQRYVGFTEVELDVHDDGAVDVHLMLPEFAHVAPAVHAQWFAEDAWLVALARCRPGHAP